MVLPPGAILQNSVTPCGGAALSVIGQRLYIVSSAFSVENVNSLKKREDHLLTDRRWYHWRTIDQVHSLSAARRRQIKIN